MSTTTAHGAPPASSVLPRLLAGADHHAPCSLSQHLARWGQLDVRLLRQTLVQEVEAAGVVGHGGAAFPVAAKWLDVARHRFRRPIVVANGAEGEPASRKDAVLLASVPHLVLDGAVAAAAALHAAQVLMYVPQALVPTVQAAVSERRNAGIDPVPVGVVAAPPTFLAGQESAVVNALNGHVDAVPSFLGAGSVRERGVGGRPTLVHNVETLAHVALVARFGAAWYRGIGTDQHPGSLLLTVQGRWAQPVVLEAPAGTPLHHVLAVPPAGTGGIQGILIGGYGGGWVAPGTALSLPLTEPAARQAGASLGPGVVVLMPPQVCPLAEVARVVRFMQLEGGGQCGPCVHGLAALASGIEALAFGSPTGGPDADWIVQICTLVEGRGACRHPDGVARFVRSATHVFAEEIAVHRRSGPCARTAAPPFMPTPGLHPGPRRPAQGPLGAIRPLTSSRR